MPEQLEFDLVSPWLAAPSRVEQRLLDEAAELLGQGRDKMRLARIAAELQRQEVLVQVAPSTELAELRVLLGPAIWKKARRRWERRLKKNPMLARRAIIVLRNLITE